MILNYIFWNVDPEIFNFFGVTVRYYGLLFGIGLLLCCYTLSWIFRREKQPRENLNKLFLYGFISIFAGARLGHFLFYEPAYYLSHPLEIILPFSFPQGGDIEYTGFQGLASHGGTIGLILAVIIYSIKTREPVIKTLDMVALVAPLGACFIRLANLMNSEIIGKPANVEWAFVFVKVDNLPRHPAQLYEAIIYLLIFFLLLFLYRSGRLQLNSGLYFGLGISLIFIARFLIEFLKEKQVDFEKTMKLDMGQILSIPLILVAIGFIIYGMKKT